jgi:hypothetical protein
MKAHSHAPRPVRFSINEANVLRLNIGVHELQGVHEMQRFQRLAANIAHSFERVRAILM